MLSVLIYHVNLSKEYQQPVLYFFFFKKKNSVKRRPFDSSDTLAPRIVETCSRIILGESQVLIRLLGSILWLLSFIGKKSITFLNWLISPWRSVASVNCLYAKQMVADSDHGERQTFGGASNSYCVFNLVSVAFHPVLSFDVDRKIYRTILVRFLSVE